MDVQSSFRERWFLAPRILGLVLGATPVTVLAVLAPACFDFSSPSAGSADSSPSPLEDAGLGDSADAAPEADGSPMNGADADAGSTFCSGFAPGNWRLFFCSDFDPPEPPFPGPWAQEQQTGGTLVADDRSYASPPNSLDENVTALNATDPIDDVVQAPFAFPSLPATIKLSVAIDPVAIDVQANAAILLAAIDFLDTAQRQYSVQLAGNVVSEELTLGLGEVS
jgi:hypothetical protein